MRLNRKGEYSPNDADVRIPADFETAVKASGFGRFNILLLLVSFPGVVASVMETAVISYILPSAECDLNLNLVNKGLLNGISFGGMIVSAIGWGHLADSKGRKNILVWGYLAHFLMVLCAAMSQNIVQLMIAKFFGGFILCGPFSVVMTYLTEFHDKQHRAPVLMIVGVMYSLANLILPLLAIMILPNDLNFTIFSMQFTAWKVFLAVCGIPSLLGGTLFSFFPESPRFLITQGRNAEALEIFQTVYAINSRKSRETYPILELRKEFPQNVENPLESFGSPVAVEDAIIQESLDSCKPTKQMILPSPLKTLCAKPYLMLSIQVYLLNFCVLLGSNTMRLWLPQLFASIYEYQQFSSETSSMCKILEYNVNKTELIKDPEDTCIVFISASTYTNNLIVAGVILIGFSVAGTLINALGDKRAQIISLFISGTCGLALYWSSTLVTLIIISSIYACMGGIAKTSCISTSANLFPTSSRTMIVVLAMTFGRIGSIVGNIIFPVLMSYGCVPPIVMIGGIMFVGSLLASFLPNTKKSELM